MTDWRGWALAVAALVLLHHAVSWSALVAVDSAETASSTQVTYTADQAVARFCVQARDLPSVRSVIAYEITLALGQPLGDPHCASWNEWEGRGGLLSAAKRWHFAVNSAIWGATAVAFLWIGISAIQQIAGPRRTQLEDTSRRYRAAATIATVASLHLAATAGGELTTLRTQPDLETLAAVPAKLCARVVYAVPLVGRVLYCPLEFLGTLGLAWHHLPASPGWLLPRLVNSLLWAAATYALAIGVRTLWAKWFTRRPDARTW